MSPPLLPQDITMTSETETALDLVQDALKIFHDIAAVDIGESEADEDHFRNSSRTYALAGPVTVGDIRKAALAYEQLAALSRAPEAEELGSSTRMTSPASRSPEPLSAGEVDLPNYWRAVVGDTYKPAVLRNVKHMHPTTVKEVFDRHAGTDVADVIAGLIFTNQIANNRSEFFAEEYAKARADQAALSPPSTGGEGEAVAWRCLNVHGDAFLTEDANGAHFWLKSGKPVQPLYLHPSPEMGEITAEEIARTIAETYDPVHWWGVYETQARAILSKLKENGLSREELGGSAGAGSGAACPSDCAEGHGRRSDGGRV